MDEGWKRDLSQNFSFIVKHVDNPDTIAEYLHYDCNPPVFTEEDVQWMKEGLPNETTKNKTRMLLNKLTYKPNYPLVALYSAFKENHNTELRKCLVKHVESYYKSQRKDIKAIPANSLPLDESTWNKFHEADVTKCLVESDYLLKTYNDTDRNYTMTKETRGRAVILNNLNFEEENKKRTGSEKDVELLTKTLTQLHFDVQVYNDLTTDEIRKKLEEERKSDGHKPAQCFILVVMSHGDITGIKGTKDNVMPYQEFAELFNATNCPALKDKPKLIFFQSCRTGSQDLGADLDCSIGQETRRIQGTENNKDFLFAFATVEGCASMRREDTGAWFIQALCWVLKYEAHGSHLLEILTKVNALVMGMEEDGQICHFVPEYRGSLLKNVHFFPGVCGSNPVKNEKVGKSD